MKNKIMQLFLLLGLVVGVGSVAQAAPRQLTVPFDFTVNGKLMKAGTYEIRFNISSSNTNVFMLRSADGKNVAIVTPTVSERVSKGTQDINAIFEKNGDSYLLAEVQSPRASIKLAKNTSVNVTRVEFHAAAN